MKFKLIPLFFLCLFLFSISTVYSAPPSNQATLYTSAPEISIVYPKFESFPNNYDISLHFHVFNSSGYILKNDTTSCLIHVYNHTGNHIIEQNLTWDSNDIEFYINLPKETFTYQGYYSYIVQCESDIEAGYISTDFLISSNFEKYNEKIIAFVIAVAFFSIFLLYFAFNLDKDHFLIKLLSVFFSLANLILIPTVFINGVTNTSKIFFNIPLAYVTLFAIYFFIYISWYYLNKLKDSIR